MDYQTIILEKEDYVATVTLNRPDRLNEITPLLLEEFQHAMIELRADDDVRAVVITGAGRGFCAGEDLKEAPQSEDSMKTATKRGVLAVEVQPTFPVVMRGMPKPVIAAVNGAAVGMGFGITLACDIRIASEKRFVVHVHVSHIHPDGHFRFVNVPTIIACIRESRTLVFHQIAVTQRDDGIDLSHPLSQRR